MRRARQQSGYIYKRGGWWVLRYRDTVPENGQLVRRQMARQIEPVKPEHMRLKRPPPEIEDKARTMLQPLNNHTYTPEAMQTVEQFVENVYFPNVETQKRASTVRGYKTCWNSQLKPYCGSFRLREFRPSDAQRALSEIARQSPSLCRNTLHHLRSLLSAIFRHAIQQGYLNGHNPIRDVGVPTAPEGDETYAYSLEEVTRMLTYLPQPAYTIAAIAAFTGLRRAELTGLLWEATTETSCKSFAQSGKATSTNQRHGDRRHRFRSSLPWPGSSMRTVRNGAIRNQDRCSFRRPRHRCTSITF